MTTTSDPPAPEPMTERQVARGVLDSVSAPTATKPGFIVLAIPGSQYRLHLQPVGGIESIRTPVGKKIAGVITCQTRRVDRVATGGRLVEPVTGRPRRVHGTVLAVDPAAGTITLNAGGAATVDAAPLPIVAKLGDPRQRPDHFAVGDLVAFDAQDGATFKTA